ncbi:Shedu anti-phage system protein SduA domain-containing protein [Paenibacillus rubinfantis]|uniref:Shedu anti-phage system protein SduA domain-containing protein n=1 Tax=Paenibacillus rubinfantis TaxID=1720296 RepID=UPI00073E2C80|nr:Shedu anti-phage system protein SduA domain-containing protein [Paenibacillus rubinfantis]
MDKREIPVLTEEEFGTLLENMTATPEAYKERAMHDFLEKNPAMIPCLDGATMHRHHGPVGSLVFTEYQLAAGHFKREPDFLFVTSHSQANTFVFVEIEHPGKPIFNQDDSLNAHFYHAYEQLQDWASWFNAGNNKGLLIQELARVNKGFELDKEVDAEFVLVIGRRAEFEGNPTRMRRIHRHNKAPFYVMSYDRLRYDHTPYCQRLAVVHQKASGLEAVQFPRDYYYDYNQRGNHRLIRNKEKAIMENVYMTQPEKDQLLQTIREWDSLDDKKARERFLLGSK